MAKIIRLTPSILRKAQEHLAVSCPAMVKLVAAHGPCRLTQRDTRPFQTLVNSIIAQQVSYPAANAIKARVRQVAPDLAPGEFLALEPETLRSAGLSGRKVQYILGLAQRASDGRIEFDTLKQAPDEQVIETLTEAPGIGRWTAEMFLIFGLHRPDVLSLGDVGLQRAARLLFGEDAKLQQVAEPWRPYRSVASWYLWQSLH